MKILKVTLFFIAFWFIASTASAIVNLNTATKAQLKTLSGVGEKTAQKILDYRSAFGGFAKIEDIQHITGIGPKSFEKIKKDMTVGNIAKLNIKPYRGTKKYAGKVVPGSKTKKRAYRRTTVRYTYSGKVNINTARRSILERLPHIGRTTANRIIAFRKKFKFNKIEELKKVKGFGDKLYESIKYYIKVAGKSDFKAITHGTKRRKSGKKVKINGKININTASATALTALPGIGPSKAKRIVDYRKTKGKFNKIIDIKKVKGIGPKTFEKLKQYLTTE